MDKVKSDADRSSVVPDTPSNGFCMTYECTTSTSYIYMLLDVFVKLWTSLWTGEWFSPMATVFVDKHAYALYANALADI